MEPIYTEGDVIELYCDIYPGFVHSDGTMAAGVPGQQVKKRVVVTERCLTVLWEEPGTRAVRRLDIPMTLEDTANTTFRGGPVGPYMVGTDSGCSGCGGSSVRNATVWPGIVSRQVMRRE